VFASIFYPLTAFSQSVLEPEKRQLVSMHRAGIRRIPHTAHDDTSAGCGAGVIYIILPA